MSNPFRQRRVVEEPHTFSSTAIIQHPQEKLNSQIVFGWGRFNDHMSRTQHKKIKHAPAQENWDRAKFNIYCSIRLRFGPARVL